MSKEQTVNEYSKDQVVEEDSNILLPLEEKLSVEPKGI